MTSLSGMKVTVKEKHNDIYSYKIGVRQHILKVPVGKSYFQKK